MEIAQMSRINLKPRGFMDKRPLGKWGEDKAVNFLKKRGHKILDRNYQRRASRFLKSEIDIISKKGKIIHFVEVKTLESKDIISPEEHVSRSKLRKIAKTAENYLVEKAIPLESFWQIDVVSIVGTREKLPEITYFENVTSDFQ